MFVWSAAVISLVPTSQSSRARLTRRDLLRMSAAGAVGVSLPQLLAVEAVGAAEHHATAKHCIYVFLCGGPSQLDMWDPKPDAPGEIRGPFQPLSTNVPGIQLTELLPRTATHADKLAILRSLTHDSSDHATSIMYTLLATGSPPSRETFPPTRRDHPAIGAGLHHVLGAPADLPAWVVLPRYFTTGSRLFKGQTAGFLGPHYDAFALDEPKHDSLADKNLAVRSLEPLEGLAQQRFRERMDLVDDLGQIAHDGLNGPQFDRHDEYRNKAFSLVFNPQTSRAFDLEQEPATLRDRYGRNEYGQSFLLARRLTEAGVRMVNVFWTYYGDDGCQFNLWDNHGIDGPVCGGYSRGVDMIKAPYCCPAFDLAYSALLEDLDERGLLDETLVVVIGEFGRTPTINKNAGRDHWPHCYSAVLAGGGVQGGQVYGASDRHAAYVRNSPVTPDDFGATIYYAFGIDPETRVYDQTGRPVAISAGEPVTAVF